MSHAPRTVSCVQLVRAVVLAAAVAGLCLPAELAAQGRGRGRFVELPDSSLHPAYDGRLLFARIRYAMGNDFSAFGGFRRGGRDLPWSHDYPRGERNFTRILGELTTIRTRTEESAIVALNDPQLFRYPVAYMAEPGFWRPNDAEAAGLRAYLRKGGFILFDDFRGSHWVNLEAQMQRVLPGLRFIRIDGTHPIFDAFYRIPQPEALASYGDAVPSFWAIFEDNDPRKRMLALANRDNDLSEYWEFSGEGFYPVDLTNEAYKLGINYLVYALSR